MPNETTPPYRRLGRTALKVGPLAVGTVNFGWLTDEQDSFAILDAAIERGLNLIDTSDNYNAGVTESLLGRYFSGSGKREEVVLATKCFSPPAEFGSKDPVKASGSWVGPNQRGLSAKHIIEACNASLKRLNTEYIDLYQMHHVDRTAPFEEVWQAYETLVAQGKVIYVGTSNFAGWQIAKACESARSRHFLGPVSEQSVYSLLNRTVELEVIPACRDYGLGFIPYSPLGGGLLAAASGAEDGKRSKGLFSVASEKKRQQLQQYAEICKDLGEHPADVAIAWVASNPDVTSPIIGPRTMAQLESALRGVEIELPLDIRERLDTIFPGPGGEAPEAYAW
ncbi:MAG: aldo/keto reductase [Proteobacteria bacterium]|jgi:aryl-alcohol dehydrogenase-like predicted oxidoreductase|nr:aldo/keto reductase [Pseudomonadota bacterium]MDA1301891.1 aldo/keto reductase [Pseudomonadota bacterium]